jgi:hypothetical protein
MNTTTGSGTVKNCGFDVGVLFMGWFLGVINSVILFIMVNKDTPIEIQSNKRIQPEKRLTTDGKTVDTLFIYKQER